PLINGSDLIRQLKAKVTHQPQIYVISWQLSEQVVLGLLEMGVDQYMTFPISIERLKSKIITINNMLNI
ncbi:MAG: response regulator transcription factor, partial [Alistipes sp.]|nr:response regulator transcription factor [Alistipes sp.]